MYFIYDISAYLPVHYILVLYIHVMPTHNYINHR